MQLDQTRTLHYILYIFQPITVHSKFAIYIFNEGISIETSNRISEMDNTEIFEYIFNLEWQGQRSSPNIDYCHGYWTWNDCQQQFSQIPISSKMTVTGITGNCFFVPAIKFPIWKLEHPRKNILLEFQGTWEFPLFMYYKYLIRKSENKETEKPSNLPI